MSVWEPSSVVNATSIQGVPVSSVTPTAGQELVLVGGSWTPSSETGAVASVGATDASIVVTGTASNPTLATGTLDVIANQHAPTAAVALNAQKITGLANGTVATDGAAFGQLAAKLGLTQINGTTSGVFTAVVGDIINTTAAATITLPATPTIGQCVMVNRGNHTALITINAGAGQTINGAANCSMVAVGAVANVGEALFVAQSATAWSAIALGTDLAFGVSYGGTSLLQTTVIAGSSLTINSSLLIHNALKTANYSTAAGDLWIRATGSWTLTLTTVTNKVIFAANEGTGVITVVASSGSVTGATSLPAGASAIYLNNGTNWDTVAVMGFSNTGAGAVASTPSLGAAAQLANTTVDTMLYIDVTAAATTLVVAIGPTPGVANTLVSAATAPAGALYSVRLPAGWYVAVTTATGTWSATAITC